MLRKRPSFATLVCGSLFAALASSCVNGARVSTLRGSGLGTQAERDGDTSPTAEESLALIAESLQAIEDCLCDEEDGGEEEEPVSACLMGDGEPDTEDDVDYWASCADWSQKKAQGATGVVWLRPQVVSDPTLEPHQLHNGLLAPSAWVTNASDGDVSRPHPYNASEPPRAYQAVCQDEWTLAAQVVDNGKDFWSAVLPWSSSGNLLTPWLNPSRWVPLAKHMPTSGEVDWTYHADATDTSSPVMYDYASTALYIQPFEDVMVQLYERNGDQEDWLFTAIYEDIPRSWAQQAPAGFDTVGLESEDISCQTSLSALIFADLGTEGFDVSTWNMIDPPSNDGAFKTRTYHTAAHFEASSLDASANLMDLNIKKQTCASLTDDEYHGLLTSETEFDPTLCCTDLFLNLGDTTKDFGTTNLTTDRQVASAYGPSWLVQPYKTYDGTVDGPGTGLMDILHYKLDGSTPHPSAPVQCGFQAGIFGGMGAVSHTPKNFHTHDACPAPGDGNELELVEAESYQYPLGNAGGAGAHPDCRVPLGPGYAAQIGSAWNNSINHTPTRFARVYIR